MDKDEKLNVLECIPVIQGEGQSTGVPMILIRLGRCNLNCMFTGSICDAEESSWNHLVNDKKNKKFSLNDIQKVINQNPHIEHVMITGGQPTLHIDTFKAVAELCKENFMAVEIEDNGTTFPKDFDFSLIDLISMSPKLSNSIPELDVYVSLLNRKITQHDVDRHKSRYRNIESMKNWLEVCDYQVKFVISDEDQIKEALALAAQIGARRDNIYFMPEGATREQLDSRRKWLYEKCLELGIKYTDRLHIIVYDNKKGV